MAMPFGGGGALHAGALIKEVGLKGALVPRFPGVTSALGCVIADIRHDSVQTVNLMLDGIDAAALDARMVEAGRAAHDIVADAGLSVTRIDVLYELDMHYLGQTHTVPVPLPVTLGEGTTGVTPQIIRDAFEAAYGAAFSRLLPGIPVRVVTLRTAAIGRRPAFDLSALAPAEGATLEAARRGSRQVYLDGRWRETTIWSRLDLPVGAAIEGPAMLEQSDATILLDPGLTGQVDALGNLVILRS
jgi:N-methylhydantoinase A